MTGTGIAETSTCLCSCYTSPAGGQMEQLNPDRGKEGWQVLALLAAVLLEMARQRLVLILWALPHPGSVGNRLT